MSEKNTFETHWSSQPGTHPWSRALTLPFHGVSQRRGDSRSGSYLAPRTSGGSPLLQSRRPKRSDVSSIKIETWGVLADFRDGRRLYRD